MGGIVEILVGSLLVFGAGMAFIGSLGLARLGNFYLRLHGPAKATTLGVGSILIAAAVHFSAGGGGWSVGELLVSAFLLLTAPISAHLLVKAALHLHRQRGEGADLGLPAPPPQQSAATDQFTK